MDSLIHYCFVYILDMYMYSGLRPFKVFIERAQSSNSLLAIKKKPPKSGLPQDCRMPSCERVCCHVVRGTCRECINNFILFLLCLLFRSKELIKDAILDNDFLKKLESSQIREVVECMYEKKWKKDEFLIKEGESGSDLFVLEGM